MKDNTEDDELLEEIARLLNSLKKKAEAAQKRKQTKWYLELLSFDKPSQN